ncbi:MAG: class I SAM-dependent methyltransferase [Gloeomargarita sp. GMQP_bins_5]
MAFKFPETNWQALLSPERATWQSLDVFFQVAQPRAQEVWADIGCGPGYFTLPLAERVHKVYALDSSPWMLERCRERAVAQGYGNVETRPCEETAIPLPDKSVDVSLLANLVHELLQPQAFLAAVGRITRARVHVIDWHPVPSPAGPPLVDRLPKDQVIDLLTGLGFVLVQDAPVYPYHYFLTFRPPASVTPG